MLNPETITAAVHAYVAAFDAGTAEAAAALFAPDATVEDPLGTPPKQGHAAILEFYRFSMQTGAKLQLEGPVRIAGAYAAFSFSVILLLDGITRRIDVIDTFRFNEAGKITEMRAFWGPTNMHGF